MGEDSNYSVMSKSQDGTDFSNKIDLAVGVEPAVEWSVLFEKYVPSWEFNITEWLESSPMALTEVSEHAA